jgi:hypothetical protein
MKKENSEDVKEDFCGACAMAIPTALGMTGTAALSGNTSGTNKKYKIILFWISIAITVLSVAAFIYFKKTCSSCR